MQSDVEIIEKVLAGETAAFAILVRRYERAVLAAATAVLGNVHAAEDVTQDAFVKAYENLASLRNGSAFGCWLITIGRREALTLAGKTSKERDLGAPADARVHQQNDQLDEQLQRLLTKVMKLPEHERDVVMLRHFEGHSVRATADMTGRPVGTVTKQLSRAYARLRNRLEAIEP
jgi:RNA polymerase sigma-70 factor (ECF subfamily)